eukprot:CAMPEP_0118858172 /NCGR_PEP_ID=MMETSP1163-20130328/4945_1 /TAXON_ID=124430 /ORGANISM="Phaeomonas parva, Strain CCMP2877" /LENGTH=406 /DNA_ID=CAMNT_0006791597 /DNA_START=153 /DNA_END=1374 /DNA_ORIENTATION=+
MPPKAGLAAAVLVATASALCTPTPRRALIVEFDVLADTTSLESAVHLEAAAAVAAAAEGCGGAAAVVAELGGRAGRSAGAPLAHLRPQPQVRARAEGAQGGAARGGRDAPAAALEEDAVGRRAIAARNDPSGRRCMLILTLTLTLTQTLTQTQTLTLTLTLTLTQSISPALTLTLRYPGGGWAPTKGALKGVRPGTRPLTAGEVVENWGDLLRERCEDTWRGEDGAEAADAIDAAVASLYDEHLRTAGPSPSPEELVQLEWRREVVEAVADARELVVTLRGDAGLGAAAARLGEQEEREAWSARLGEEGGLGPLRIEIIRSAADVVDLVDASLAAGPVTYVGASPLLTRGVTSALRQPLEGGALGVAHCAWPTRFDDGQELFGRVQGVHVAGVPGDLDQALAKAAA